jgi:hypothetical protein
MSSQAARGRADGGRLMPNVRCQRKTSRWSVCGGHVAHSTDGMGAGRGLLRALRAPCGRRLPLRSRLRPRRRRARRPRSTRRQPRARPGEQRRREESRAPLPARADARPVCSTSCSIRRASSRRCASASTTCSPGEGRRRARRPEVREAALPSADGARRVGGDRPLRPLAPERRRFVKLFLEELMHLPRALWRPLLVAIDEAHVFCPERGHRERPSRPRR